MIDFLLIMLVVAALIQRDQNARAAACTFVGLTLAFDFITIPDDYYHLAAATTDAFCVLILSKLTDRTGMVTDLQYLCLISILINLAGWVCYEMYLPATAYNIAFLFFYFTAILMLILRRVGNAEGPTTTNIPGLPFSYYKSIANHRINKGEARN